ncbi:MAG: PIN domain-containing protein [Anaerolineae bacterium]|nr:PIN domain-containing protein [Anaerolineae bacterium]
MAIIEELRNTIVGIDTAPFIYFIERNDNFHTIVQPVFAALDAGTLQAVTSTITLAEVLVQPLRNNRPKLAQRYREILQDSVGLSLINVTPDVAERTAQFRAAYQLRTPDAIQIATALQANATHFLTNDRQLRKITEIKVLLLSDFQRELK